MEIEGCNSSIRCLVLVDASHFFVGMYSGKMHLMSLTALSSPILELEAHTSYVNDMIFIQNESLLASGSDDETVKLWNTSKID